MGAGWEGEAMNTQEQALAKAAAHLGFKCCEMTEPLRRLHLADYFYQRCYEHKGMRLYFVEAWVYLHAPHGPENVGLQCEADLHLLDGSLFRMTFFPRPGLSPATQLRLAARLFADAYKRLNAVPYDRRHDTDA